MKHFSTEKAIAELETELDRPLSEMERGCLTNAVDGYHAGINGLREIKQSIHDASAGLLMIGDDQLLEFVDALERVCDRLLRSGIAESN